MMKKPNYLDPRSLRGTLLRGKNIYPNGTSPNPVGKNQHNKFNYAEAARKRLSRGNSY